MLATDYQITHSLNLFAFSYPYLAGAVSIFASDSAFVLVGILFYFWYKTRPSLKKVHVDMLIVALLSGFMARFALKAGIVSFFLRARPYVAHADVVPLIQPPLHEEMLSFPSGHALFFFAVSTVVFRHHKKLGSIFYTVSALMVSARVVAGVHYPTDIIAGAVLGICTALVCMKLTKKFLPL